MERIKCFKCRQFVNGGLDGLSTHLKFNHGMTINRGYGHTGFECAQDECQKRFALFSSLRRHIVEQHLNQQDFVENVVEIGDELLNINNDGLENEFENANDNEQRDFEEFQEYENVHFDNHLRALVACMISRLQSKPSMTGASVADVLDECEQLLKNLTRFLKFKVRNFLRDREILDNEEGQELLGHFNFENVFSGLQSTEQQIKVLKENYNYIEAVEIPLGHREDTGLDKESGTFIPKLVPETFQYVPIIKVLSLILQNDEVRNAILLESGSEEGVLSSFVDGQHFKQHEFFQRYKNAIRIEIYFDDVEIANPLGSKTVIHKLGVVLYRIQNMPVHMNSKLGSIHTACIAYSDDIKKYGFDKIFHPFMRDIKKLESNEGVTIQIGNEDFILRGSIAGFCGDGLAVQQVFGLLEPAANRFCRMCLITRAELHERDLTPKEERTKEIFEHHIEQIKNARTRVRQQEIMTETGVRKNCPLNESKYFHNSRNKIFDPMHDFFLGIIPMTLKLTIHQFVFVDHLFTVSYLNDRISAFNYGVTESKNKPSSNFTEAIVRNIDDHSLPQKAMQMWCLIRVFPFLMTEKVTHGNKYMNIIILLLRILEIVMAPKVTKSILPYLRHLTTDFFEVFGQLFPGVNFINKFHHASHYADCMEWSGPICLYSCMRYEAKHGPMKQRAQVIHNFKNCPKSLVRIHQSTQSAFWGAQDVTLYTVQCEQGEMVQVSDCLSTNELHHLGYIETDRVFSAKSVRVNGTLYRNCLIVCLDVKGEKDVNLPKFGYITEIIVINRREVFLRCIQCETISFDPDLNAFSIEIDEERGLTCFVSTNNLGHYKALSIWSHTKSDELFVSLRHILL